MVIYYIITIKRSHPPTRKPSLPNAAVAGAGAIGRAASARFSTCGRQRWPVFYSLEGHTINQKKIDGGNL